MDTEKTQAIREAARTSLEHGGPECRTDPRIPNQALGHALDLGATIEDVTAEMARQRQQ